MNVAEAGLELRERAVLEMRTLLGRVTPLRNAYRRWINWHRDEDLRLFHDVLSAGPLAGKWRVFGGVILGVERAGMLIEWDRDIDVVVLREDFPALVRSISDLKECGFRLKENFVGSDGTIIGVHLRRHSFQFDFFVADLGAHEDASTRSDLNLFDLQFRELVIIDRTVFEQTGRIPYSEVDHVGVVGRTWPCSSDRPAELALMYGPTWRVPDRSWKGSAAPYAVKVAPYKGLLGTWTPLEGFLNA
jgi:hypothetical protein